MDARDVGMNTALHWAAAGGYTRCVELLLKRGASVTTCNARGCSALSCAAAAGHSRLVADLVAAGADVNHRDDTGRTPLLLAVERGQHVRTTRVLLDAGASPELAAADGRFPLLVAAENSHVDLLHLLLQAGARVDQCRQATDGSGPPTYGSQVQQGAFASIHQL